MSDRGGIMGLTRMGREHGARSTEHGAGSWELGAGSWELGAGSWERGVGTFLYSLLLAPCSELPAFHGGSGLARNPRTMLVMVYECLYHDRWPNSRPIFGHPSVWWHAGGLTQRRKEKLSQLSADDADWSSPAVGRNQSLIHKLHECHESGSRFV